MFNVFDLVRGWKIDFIFQKASAFHRAALRRRTYAHVEGVPLAIIAPEDLIVAKLDWAKAGASWRQIEDVAGILKVRSRSLDRPYIEKWLVSWVSFLNGRARGKRPPSIGLNPRRYTWTFDFLQ
jgi:hypothetical protein